MLLPEENQAKHDAPEKESGASSDPSDAPTKQSTILGLLAKISLFIGKVLHLIGKPLRKFGASFRNPDCTVTNSERELKWELEKHLTLYRFYFDLSVKAIALFYAIVGATLSISFAKDTGANPEVKRFLLWAPFVVSLVIGTAFFTGGIWWWRVKRKVDWIAKKVKMIQVPDIAFLSYVLWIFGILFFFAAWGLYRIDK